MNAPTQITPRLRPEWLVDRQGKTVVLYQGLLALAHEDGLTAIRTQLLQVPAEDNERVAIVSAVVEMADGKTFSGIGDASPRNVARPMVEATIRFAETRAKARALRDAVNIGLVALEELPDEDEAAPRPTARPTPIRSEAPAPRNGWATTEARWATLVADARAAGVPEEALAPITKDMDKETVVRRIEEVKAATAKARELTPAPATSGLAATPAQVKAIYAVGGSEAGLKATGVDEISQGRYGALPAELTKRQASELLDHLRTLGRPIADEDLPF